MLTRRDLLKSASSGVGYLAFAALAHEQANAEKKTHGPLSPKEPHFLPRAKRVIFLSMRGAPSHVDMFDYKPKLNQDSGKPGRFGSGRGGKLLGSPWKFKRHGKSGLWISELTPEIGSHADDLCMLNGMHTDLPNHPQAQTMMHTGSSQFVRPSMGAWTLYGLGTDNEDLPGFIALGAPNGNANHFGSGFLPAIYQGTRFSGNSRRLGGNNRFARRDSKPNIPNIANPKLDRYLQRLQLDYVQS